MHESTITIINLNNNYHCCFIFENENLPLNFGVYIYIYNIYTYILIFLPKRLRLYYKTAIHSAVLLFIYRGEASCLWTTADITSASYLFANNRLFTASLKTSLWLFSSKQRLVISTSRPEPLSFSPFPADRSIIITRLTVYKLQ